MMALPQQLLISGRVQILDNGERMKIALQSLERENGRLNNLVVLFSERVVEPFPGERVVPLRQPESGA
jgi:hypothetical protein